MFLSKKNLRYLIICGIILFICVVYIYRLMQIQIVHGAEYEKQSVRRVLDSHQVIAERGAILDRYGRPLVNNRLGYTIQILDVHESEEELNGLIYRLLKVFDTHDVVVNDSMPISLLPPYEFTFDGANEQEKKQNEINWKKERGISKSSNVVETIEQLKEKYSLDKDISVSDAKKIIGIREQMKRKGFNESNPFTIVTDININLVMLLEERHTEYEGIKIKVEPIRNYASGNLAAHILGRVGIIFAEEYEELKDKGYGMNDILGKVGIEKVMESELKGKDGSRRVEQDINGNTIKVIENNPAVPGNNVILSIDSNLQKVAEESLKNTIEEIREDAKQKIGLNPKLKNIGEDVTSGAVVAMDVNTGEVLAMATYPSYNPETFNNDYSKLLNDPLKPLLNRAVAGTYSPGSTFKMLTAIAGLEEGIITKEDIISCGGVYRYYEYAGYTPHCWIHTAAHGYATHGPETVTDALRDSCNYYFYDVGRRLTIKNIEKYAKIFGLGSITGIELGGENSGILGGPESRERTGGGPWYPGETLGAAIGEMHAFTPIQLASYVNTIAAKGVRYRPHIVKKVIDYKGNTVSETKPEIIDKLDIHQENLSAILEGMKEVTGESGTASRIFKNYPIKVAGKTGTAEMRNSSSNGIFVGFAPFSNPKISVAVVIEHGGSGGNTAPVARDIISSYLDVYEINNNEFPSNSLIP